MVLLNKKTVLLNVVMALTATSLPLYQKRETNSYDLVSQIGDGQIQAPTDAPVNNVASTLAAVGTTSAPPASAPPVQTGALQPPATSGPIPGANGFSGGPVSLPFKSLQGASALDETDSQPSATLAPTASTMSPQGPATNNGKSTNTFALVTQIFDGQIQAPYESSNVPSVVPSSTLDATHSLIPLTTSQAIPSQPSPFQPSSPLVPLTTSQAIPSPSSPFQPSSPLVPLTTSQPIEQAPTPSSSYVNIVPLTETYSSRPVPSNTLKGTNSILSPPGPATPSSAKPTILASAKTSNTYDLISQIGDGQIQAPAPSTTAPTSLIPLTTSQAYNPPSPSSTLDAHVSSLIPLTTSQPIEQVPTSSNVPPSDLIPLTTSQPIEFSSNTLKATDSVLIPPSSSPVSIPTGAPPLPVASSILSAPIPSVLVTPSSSLFASAKTTNTFDLVTQIGDGQIQAPAPSSSLDATHSLIPLTTSQPYNPPGPSSTLDAHVSSLIPLTTSQPIEQMPSSSGVPPSDSDLIPLTTSQPIEAPSSTLKATDSVLTPQSPTPVANSNPSVPVAPSSSLLASAKTSNTYPLITQISDGQIQAPAETFLTSLSAVVTSSAAPALSS